ncbi:MAG: ATP-binding protein [Desulfobacterales bacterium]
MKKISGIFSQRRAFFRLMPAWKGSLILFSLLILSVLVYFFWQEHQLRQVFLSHSLENSRMLGAVIERNAQSALLSQETVEKIISIFLGNTARFVEYLDGIEAFSSSELSAFAEESGLTGIRIIREKGEISEGPPGWAASEEISCLSQPRILHHLPSVHLFLMIWPFAEKQGCVMVGFDAAHIETLQEQIGLPRLLETLSVLPDIQYLRLENSGETHDGSSVFLKQYQGRQVAETRMPFGSEMLVLGMDTSHFLDRCDQMRKEFFFFSAILAFAGLFFSWLFHRSQTLYLSRIREVEREMAKEREDASLGRAAASIAHEIRNPLNAISMGLQRMQMEVEELPEEYQILVTDMLHAVARTNGIVSDIRRYADPPAPISESVLIEPVISRILGLYRQKCTEQNIKTDVACSRELRVAGDPRMLEQILENLIRNAVEAQPGGGFLRIAVKQEEGYAVLSAENSGFNLDPKCPEQMLEPCFTTKTRGTGLGLSIVDKIVCAHSGRIELEVPESGILKIKVFLRPAENDMRGTAQ